MKRSEFVDIVNAVAHEEGLRLAESLKNCEKGTDPYVFLAAQMPGAAARIAAEIMTRSGLIHFDPEDAV